MDDLSQKDAKVIFLKKLLTYAFDVLLMAVGVYYKQVSFNSSSLSNVLNPMDKVTVLEVIL